MVAVRISYTRHEKCPAPDSVNAHPQSAVTAVTAFTTLTCAGRVSLRVCPPQQAVRLWEAQNYYESQLPWHLVWGPLGVGALYVFEERGNEKMTTPGLF